MMRTGKCSRALIVGMTLAFTVVAGHALTGQNPAPADPAAATVKNPEAAKVKNPVPATPESIAAGEALYQKNCVQCHGWDGTGGPPVGAVTPPSLADDAWDHGGTDGEIFDTIRQGVPPDLVMMGWKNFSDTDIWNLVNYIRSLHQPKK